MYKRILVPMDDTCKQLVLAHSLRLAQLCEANLTFLHILLPQASDKDRTGSEKLLAYAKAQAEQNGLEAITRMVTAEQATTAILDIEQDYDLIVLATHGRQQADRLVLGSVSEELIRNSNKPHLVLRCDSGDDFDLIEHYRQSHETS